MALTLPNTFSHSKNKPQLRKEIQMKIRVLSTGIACLLFLMNATPTLAKQRVAPSSDWATVKALSVGERLSVRTKEGKKFDGTLSAVSDTNITLVKKSKSIELDAAIVMRVYRVLQKSVGKSTARSAAIGAAVGFGVGAAWGIALGTYEDINTAEAVGILGGTGAAIGAGAGALAGLLSSVWKEKTLIYEAK